MNDSIAETGYFAPWTPKELGTPKATAVAVVIVALIVFGLLGAYEELMPKPPQQVIQVTAAQLTQLPAPTPPPPPPKVVPPPKPIPAIIPKPLPVPSKIVVATKPPPPHHIFKPVSHPVAQPAPPVPVPPRPTPPPVAVAPTSGIPVYGSEMHDILQSNQNVPPALASLGISGTAILQITVASNGHVLSARLVKSSGNPLIDQTALDHAMHASFGEFNADMPQTPQVFTVPVEIEPQDDDGN